MDMQIPKLLAVVAISLVAVFLLYVLVNEFSPSVDQQMYVGTNKDYFEEGEQVIINGRLNIFLPNTTMQFWIVAKDGGTIWTSQVYNQPYDHSGYQTTSPPLSIFTSAVSEYYAFATSSGYQGSHTFSYYVK